MPAVNAMPGEGVISSLKPRTTYLPSEKIKQWSDRIRDVSLFSARTTRKSYLEAIRERLASIARRDEIPLVGEKKLKATLASLGYTPSAGFPGDMAHYHGRTIPPAIPGSMTDLSSTRRIQLVIDTNVKQARSMGQIASSENPVFLMANPAWHLTRTGSRAKPRKDWVDRWKAAGDEVSWSGACKTAMVALKSSPIWRALGDGAGGYRDNVGSPYPPFAFGSGLAWVNVGRRAWKRLCDKEGIPDGLADVERQARSMMSAQRAGTLHVGPGMSEPIPDTVKAFVADTSRLEPTLNVIRKSIEDARKAQNKVESFRIAAEAAQNAAKTALGAFPLVDGSSALAKIANALAGVQSCVSDVSSAVSKAEDAIARASSLAVPTDDASQNAYDRTLDGISRIAEECVESVSRFVETAEVHKTSAEDAASKVPDIILAWKKSECGKIVSEAKAEVDRLDGDLYETMLDEANRKIKEHNAEMKKLGRK